MSEAKTLGMVLSGAGFLDGAEIQEAVLALLAIDAAGAQVRVFAPKLALHEIDHATQKETGQTRDVLAESARIARGRIEDMALVKGADVDGWVIPGGYGAAKNLCDFATKGEKATAHKEVTRVVREALAAHIPVGACCIAPALLAVIMRATGTHLRVTIGDDADTARALTAMGAIHEARAVTEVCVDADHRVVTAPAYMYGDARVVDVKAGIDKMVQQVLAWA